MFCFSFICCVVVVLIVFVVFGVVYVELCEVVIVYQDMVVLWCYVQVSGEVEKVIGYKVMFCKFDSGVDVICVFVLGFVQFGEVGLSLIVVGLL